MITLLTGFEPFGDWPGNPSWDGLALAAERQPQSFHDMPLVRLPVTWDGARDRLHIALEQHKPDVLVSFGMHGGKDSAGRNARTFYVEEQAYNLNQAPIPDNAGDLREAAPIRADLPADAPIKSAPGDADWLHPALIRGIEAAGFEAHHSQDPGRFVCNHLFFHALSAAQSYHKQLAVAFVHVPPGEHNAAGSLSTEEFIEAYVHIADSIRNALRHRAHHAGGVRRQ